MSSFSNYQIFGLEDLPMNRNCSDITVIVLTKNEQQNIKQCLESIGSFAKNILIVDSGSTDKTLEIAAKYNTEIVIHDFVSYAHQYNWVLDNCKITTTWILRLDADEILTDALKNEILSECDKHANDSVNGFLVEFKIFFMNKLLKYAGNYPFLNMIVWKNGFGRYTERYMGEHSILTSGQTIKLKNPCLHNDTKSIDFLISKHNWYATREVIDYFERKRSKIEDGNLYNKAKKTQGLRDSFYYKMPMFFRAKLYYWYRFYFKLGFLDGKPGKIYCLIQAYIYRVIVDAKIFEAKTIKSIDKEQ